MNESGKHTPGPWTAQGVDDDGAVFIVADNLGGLVGAALPWPTELDGEDFSRVEANARLIAATPDLLAALEAMVDRYTALVNCGDCGNWNPETESEVIAARAALTKAGSPT